MTDTPASCRAEASRQQRLANEASRAGDTRKANTHWLRSLELEDEALGIEAKEQQPVERI